ncbi:MAG: VPS10 domain-containing protein [Flavobacteriales bacterium]
MRSKSIAIICALLCIGTYSFSQKKKPAAAETPKAKELTADFFSALSFRSVGPAVTSGRIADFAVNPDNHSEYYIATASGGVWKTTNHGVTVKPIFDGQGSYSIGCVTIDPNAHTTVWVGTGENNNQRSVAYGDGVYKSMDGGASWKNMGLKNSEHIAEIIVHPANSNTIYVAAYGPVWKEGGERGVYKSTDGGTTWTCVKSVSTYTGCNDIVMDPRNPDVLYAAFHQRMRKVFAYIGGGPESAIYKSTDAGATWTKCEGGLPAGDVGRMGLAISPVNPDVLYTVIEAKDGKGGVYRSTNKGVTWEKRGGTFTSGNYYNEIACDPHNVDRIYITDTYYKVSDDGGKSTYNLGEINKHIDNHAIWVDPKNGNHLLVGCDGGVYETWDFAKSWHWMSNLPVTQFYKVSTDNALPFYHIHGGTQDNFSLGGPSRTTSATGIVNADWYVTSIGDGFETQVDPTDPNIIYAQSQYGGLIRFDRKSGEFLPIKPIEKEGEPALRWNWDSPLFISQHSNTRVYFGANKIYRTDDRGNTWTAISPDLSRQVDRNKMEIMGKVWSVDAIAKNGSTDIFGQTTTIAESKLDENMIWAGTDDGLIHLTTDGGRSWTKFDNLPGVPQMSYVHQIIASVHDKSTAYACFNHHRYGDFKPYVLKTTDAGKTWRAIQGDLPERGSVYSIAEDHVDANLLFVGTEFGCFFSNNAGAKWMQLKSGLPTIAVRDIEIQRRESALVLGTFGRGFYVMDDYTLLRNAKKEDLEKAAVIYPIKDSWMYVESLPLGLRDKGHQGSDYYNTHNPEVGAEIYFYIKDELKTIKQKRQDAEKAKAEKNEKVYYPTMDSLRLEDNQMDPYLLFTIKDESGNVIRHIKQGASAGLQRMVWDYRYAATSPVGNRYVPGPDELFGSADVGHMASPGKYSISLAKYEDGALTELAGPVDFTVKLLDNATLPRDMEGNEAFANKVADLKKALSAASDITGNMSTRLDNIDLAVLDMPAPTKDILKKSHELRRQYQDIAMQLYGDGTRARREFETAPSISDRVYGAEYVIGGSTSKVAGAQTESYEVAASQFTKVLAQMRTLDENIKALEKELEMNNAPYTPGRWPEWKK